MAKPTKPKPSINALLVIAGGLALGVSFLPFPFFWLAWVALVPMIALWDREQSVIRFVAEVYTSFLIAYAIAFFWPLLHALSSSALIAFGALLLAPLMWTIPFAASYFFRARKGRGIGLLALFSFFLTVEMVFLHGPISFPWPILGHTQARALPFIQFAEFTGVLGLSLFVLLLNGLIFQIITLNRRKRLPWVFLLFFLLVANAGFGFWRQQVFKASTNYLTIGLVQPTLDDISWTGQLGSTRLVRLTELSDSLITVMNAPPVFMIWPEMALPAPRNAARQQSVMTQLQAWTDERQVALLTGALIPKGTPGQTSMYFNSALLFRPSSAFQRYEQTRFIPFKKKVPLNDQAPWLSQHVPAHFVRGDAPKPMLFDDIHLGVLLGYEVLLGDYARSYSQSDLLVSLTLNGWWGRTPLYGQHLIYARLRAIENRRAVAQVSAHGTTALVAPDGSVIFRSDSSKPTAQLAAVPLQQRVTFYTYFGDWLGWIAMTGTVCLSLWMLIFVMFSSYRQKQETLAFQALSKSTAPK